MPKWRLVRGSAVVFSSRECEGHTERSLELDSLLEDCHLQLLLATGQCRWPWAEVLREAIAGGVDLVQVREKHCSTNERIEIIKQVLDVVDAQVPVLVNDDPQAAAALPVAGVHLGQADLPVNEARRLLGDEAWIGLSTHSAQEVRAAQTTSATHLGLGCCFATASKTVPGLLSEAEIRDAAAAAPIPLFAIGGISHDRIATLRALGIRRVAVSSAILQAQDPQAEARRIRNSLM